ncbi:hypothetical protein [Knoellia sp. LjRoot47]|uniref:hypothetical protein n=1 Tax=Knoellia sp. LjRoot47 TaxID=3342330 RepID=UPI003ECF82A5
MSDHDRTHGCDKCGQPHPRCYGHNGRGLPCGLHPITGLRVCGKHGGSAPQSKTAAARNVEEAKAAKELARLGQKVDVHPAEALLDLVHWTAGEVAYWRQVVTAIADQDEADLTWGRTKTKEGGDDRGTTEEAKPHIAYVLLERASDRLASYAAAALKAGVDERRVQLAERQGDLVASVIRRILDRLNLDEAQQALVGTVVPEELRLLISPTKETA